MVDNEKIYCKNSDCGKEINLVKEQAYFSPIGIICQKCYGRYVSP